MLAPDATRPEGPRCVAGCDCRSSKTFGGGTDYQMNESPDVESGGRLLEKIEKWCDTASYSADELKESYLHVPPSTRIIIVV